MKNLLFSALLFGAAMTIQAQNSFRAVLTSAQSPHVTGTAAFVVEANVVRFTIFINLENVIPASARLVGSQGEFPFDLGTPRIVVASPGPWPQGYDGGTFFQGSFIVPTNLATDLLAGQAALQLLGSSRGDFSGQVLPALPPSISSVRRQQLGLVQLSFVAESPYQYRVEAISTLESNGAVNSVVTNISVLNQSREAVVVDAPAATSMRFYRVRRDLLSID